MSDYSLDILVNGKPVTKYLHKGSTYIEGRIKSDYSVRFRNHTDGRVLAIISVDGLSVMDGEEATYKSGGYVVEPRDEVVVKGWRISDEEVAKFIFGAKESSYANKSGKPENTGVIGVAVFKEYKPDYTITYTNPKWIPDGYNHFYWDSITYPNNTGTFIKLNDVSSSADSSTGVICSNFVGYLGTEFGKAEKDEVVEVSFKPEVLPVHVQEIYYDTREGLIKRGVKLTRKRHIAKAFPNESKFCKPPKGWSR